MLDLCTLEEDVQVTLRGVSMLRILDRVASCNADGILRPLMQEVLEHTELERAEGQEVLIGEMRQVEELFQHCGQLQKETGIFAAGDLSRVTLKSLAQEAQENLKDVTFRGVKAEQRFCVIASHAAVFAFGVQKQADFLCDPFSALRRLRKLKSFLKLMDRVLTPKLHAKSVC